MENWLSNTLELPTDCDVEQNIPKDFLSKNFDLSSGERNTLGYNIDQMMIVGTIRNC